MSLAQSGKLKTIRTKNNVEELGSEKEKGRRFQWKLNVFSNASVGGGFVTGACGRSLGELATLKAVGAGNVDAGHVIGEPAGVANAGLGGADAIACLRHGAGASIGVLAATD